MLMQTLVRRGARWMDRYEPTWHQKVDPSKLADKDEVCVLGQTFGSAERFLSTRYFVDLREDVPWYKFGNVLVSVVFFAGHGFTSIRDPESVWKRLWEDEILKRQAGTAAPVERSPREHRVHDGSHI